MCGFVCAYASSTDASRLPLKAAANAISHRGPDDEAYYLSRQFAAAFRRLKIIDLSDRARQPMTDETSRYWIVMNGEIYNYKELRATLENEGHSFRTQSDTEVLLKSYIHMGERCVDHLNGMFAFLIWDERRRRLFGARDRFGEKPFFYAAQKGQFFFASEIKALFPLLGAVPPANRAVLRQYIEHRQADTGPNTFYEGIHCLPAAHKVLLDESGLKVDRYWQPRMGSARDEQVSENFRELFFDSLKLRLRSDVPIGTCLSGGLDSSAIVCSMARSKSNIAHDSRKTFTATYREFDESDQVKAVNDQTGYNGHEIVPIPRSLDDLAEVLWFHDEPFNSFYVFASFHVMKLAKQNGVTVLLNGQGADELLAGYKKFIKNYLWDLMRAGKFVTAWTTATAATTLVEKSGRRIAWDALRNGVRTTLRQISWLQTLHRTRSNRKPTAKFGLHPDFENETAATEPPHLDTGVSNSTLKQRLYHATFVAHLPLYLRIEDRNSMAHSLESRLPFLDHRIAEYVFGLATEYFMSRGRNKAIMRDALADILPNEVVRRKEKYGFPIPEVSWIYGSLRDEITDLLTSQRLAERELFDTNKLIRTYDSESANWQENEKALWTKRDFWFRVISTELWFRQNDHWSSRLGNGQRNEWPADNQIVNRDCESYSLTGDTSTL